MTEDEAKRAAMDGDWPSVARFVVRRGLAQVSAPQCPACDDGGSVMPTYQCGCGMTEGRDGWSQCYAPLRTVIDWNRYADTGRQAELHRRDRPLSWDLANSKVTNGPPFASDEPTSDRKR